MSHLEPTYLRIIHDGLLNGSIHKDNAADLPDGLIGLYEEAFDDGKSAVERQILLQRFAIWALLKKEVSVAFVAEILGESENEIQVFISNYSGWFNSPVSGKYQLYHERLKVFLLQKITNTELVKINEKIISLIRQIKQLEFENYYANHGYFHYWLAQFDNFYDNRFKQLYLNNDYLKIQFNNLIEYAPIFHGIYLAISYYCYQKDEIVSELLNKAISISSEEFNNIKFAFQKNAIEIQIIEIQKIKEFSNRIGDIESYFQLLIYLLSELTLEKLQNDIIYDYVIFEIKEYLESNSVPIDIYIPLINLVILAEFDQSRTSKLLFLFNHIYTQTLINNFEIVDQNSIWVKFHHKNIYGELEEKHVNRIFWIKNNILPNGYNSILFILDIWDKINQKQKELIINNITFKDISLIKKGGIHFAIKCYFIDILRHLILKDKIQPDFIQAFYCDILNRKNISHFKTCLAAVYYLKTELFNNLNEFDKIYFAELFLKRALKIKNNISFDIILNEVGNKTELIRYFNLEKHKDIFFYKRIAKISNFHPDKNYLGLNEYFFNSNTVINNLKKSIEFSSKEIENMSSWVVLNIYYIALRSNYNAHHLKNKIAQNQAKNSIFFYLLKDFELVELITQIETGITTNSLKKLIDTISFPPNKEILYTQYMMSDGFSSIDLIESIRRNSPKRNETEMNLLNRMALSLGLVLKNKNLLKAIRVVDYEVATEYNLSYHHLFKFNEILELPIEECVEFLFSNYEIIFDGQTNQSIFTEHFKLLNYKKKDEIIESLFLLSSKISNEFDYYIFRSNLFELNFKFSNNFDLKIWNARIEEYDHPYWKADAHSRVIDYLLHVDDIKSVNYYYEKYFPPNNNDFSKIVSWQNIIRYYIKTKNFNLALTLFNEQKKFPDPEYFPTEDQLKFEIFISIENSLYFEFIIDFLNQTFKDLKFNDDKYKENLMIIIDFICGNYDFLDFMDNYKSILDNWYNFDIDEIFELAIRQNCRFAVLKVLKNSKIKMRNYFINLLFRNIQKNDLLIYPIFYWMIEIPSLVNLHSIIVWHNLLCEEKK